MSADRLQDIVDWLIDGARSAPDPTEKLGQLCDRLVACGIPLWRVGLFIRTLHPDVFGRSFIWRLGQAVEAGAADFTLPDTEEFQTSPLHVAIATSKMVRHRLTQNAPLHSLVLEDLRAQGITDYVAFPLIFTDRSVHVISMQTKELAGFSEGEIGALAENRAAARARGRSGNAPAHRGDPARHLRRQPHRRAHSGRTNSPRPHRHAARRDLAVRPARLHGAVGPAAADRRRRSAQSLLRLPGAVDRQRRRRGSQIHGRRAAWRSFRPPTTARTSARFAKACWPPRARRAPRSRRSRTWTAAIWPNS